MRSESFWTFFGSVRPLLGHRAESFAKMFEHLDTFDRPVGIVETGCTRQPGNWQGDGNSTLLFDRYAQTHESSTVASVDISAEATRICRTLVSKCVVVHEGDSVKFLRRLADRPRGADPGIDLLYLDSFDLNTADTLPSALHHMKELLAVAPALRPDTLVVVDDCMLSLIALPTAGGALTLLQPARIDGKARFVADYAQHVGAELAFQGYQCGWLKMRST
jgi:Methyltransferase domain